MYVVKPEQLFLYLKKRDRPIDEAGAVLARTLPELSEKETYKFAVAIEDEISKNSKFGDYWQEVLIQAYEHDDFRDKMDVKTSQHRYRKLTPDEGATVLLLNLQRLIDDCVSAFK